jgi:hypothetical protein
LNFPLISAREINTPGNFRPKLRWVFIIFTILRLSISSAERVGDGNILAEFG